MTKKEKCQATEIGFDLIVLLGMTAFAVYLLFIISWKVILFSVVPGILLGILTLWFIKKFDKPDDSPMICDAINGSKRLSPSSALGSVLVCFILWIVSSSMYMGYTKHDDMLYAFRPETIHQAINQRFEGKEIKE